MGLLTSTTTVYSNSLWQLTRK